MRFSGLANKLMEYLPFRKTLIRMGAVLPVFLRNGLTKRLWSRLGFSMASGELVPTNMGISDHLRVMVPKEAAQILFGKPELYVSERSALNLSALLSRKAEAFVDIGANFGYFIFYIRQELGIEKPVYYFEPDPELFALLERNLRSNQLSNVRGLQQAISKQAGQITFYKNLSDASSGSITTDFVAQHQTRQITVEAVTFDSFIEQYNLEHLCLKVDIEGAEFDFIEGAKASMEKIDFLIIEVLGPAIRKEFPRHLIDNFGLHAYYMNDYLLEFSEKGEYQYVAPFYNWLFCRKTPQELQSLLQGSKFKVSSRTNP